MVKYKKNNNIRLELGWFKQSGALDNVFIRVLNETYRQRKSMIGMRSRIVHKYKNSNSKIKVNLTCIIFPTEIGSDLECR